MKALVHNENNQVLLIAEDITDGEITAKKPVGLCDIDFFDGCELSEPDPDGCLWITTRSVLAYLNNTRIEELLGVELTYNLYRQVSEGRLYMAS